MSAEEWKIVGAIMLAISMIAVVTIKPPRLHAWAFAVAMTIVSSAILVGATYDINQRTFCITINTPNE